ncbi:MAG: hypothetical protein CMF60_01735 [Magnetococcales bacterium]|nr:hypothetical protein [Magnetococcales bacterium]|tara:strand:- start:32222 stop:32590 length:369 start_codon:yes stop_codon:yes gene_type:complete
MTLKPLTQRQWPQLHQMMLAEGFPHTPQSFSKASGFLEDCICFGIFDGNDTLDAAIVLGEVTKESAFVDAVCLKERRGRWLKPQLFRCFLKWCLSKWACVTCGLNHTASRLINCLASWVLFG